MLLYALLCTVLPSNLPLKLNYSLIETTTIFSMVFLRARSCLSCIYQFVDTCEHLVWHCVCRRLPWSAELNFPLVFFYRSSKKRTFFYCSVHIWWCSYCIIVMEQSTPISTVSSESAVAGQLPLNKGLHNIEQVMSYVYIIIIHLLQCTSPVGEQSLWLKDCCSLWLLPVNQCQLCYLLPWVPEVFAYAWQMEMWECTFSIFCTTCVIVFAC